MSEGGFSDFMNNVWRLSATDKAAAVRLLEGARNHESFYPWGAHALMANYNALGRDEDARPLAAEIGQQHPDFVPSWWLQIKFSRGTSLYNEQCKRIVDYARRPEMNITKEMVVPLVESLVSVRPSDLHASLERCVEGGFIGPIDVENAEKVAHFLTRVVQDIESLGKGLKYDAWAFGFSEIDLAVILKGSVAIINLSHLGVRGLEGWGPGLAERLTVATSALMRWLPYCDDRGVSSWSTISQKDHFAAVFWRLAVAPIEWLALSPIKDIASPTSEPAMSAVRRVHFSRVNMEHVDGRLFVRPGNVEIGALWNALHDMPEALNAAETVAERAVASVGKSDELTAHYERPWTNAVENITRLSTNAGWYAKPGRAAHAFGDWAERYRAALCDGELLASHDIELLPIASLLPSFRTQRPYSWNEQGFFQILDQARVVFVTAFARDIQCHFDSGKIHELWRDLAVGASLCSLQTIAAPMSVWPYFPHESWSESFDALCDEVAHAIEGMHATVFTAACGAYGLPLVHEMNRRFGITSVYYGHQMNLYFGAVTGAATYDSFFVKNATSPHWLLPDLTKRFPGVARIDGGRYIPPSGEIGF